MISSFLTFIYSILSIVFMFLSQRGLQIIEQKLIMPNAKRKPQQIGDLRLYLTPNLASFSSQTQNYYKFYMQKGPQVIGEIRQSIPPQSTSKIYNFSKQVEPVEFHLSSQRYATYVLSCYSIHNDKEEFIESSTFSLENFLGEYVTEFRKKQSELFHDMKQRQHQWTPVSEMWRVISNNFNNQPYKTSIKFKALNFILEITCKIINAYDDQIKQQEVLLSGKIKKNQSFRRSRTSPELKKKTDKSPIFSFYEKNQIDSHLQKPKNIQLQQDSVLKIGMVKDEKVIKQKNHKGVHFNPDTQSKKSQQSLLKIEEIANEGETAEEGKEKYLKIPEMTLKLESKDRPLNNINLFEDLLQQKVQLHSPSSKGRQIILGIILTVVYGVAIFFLLHPISKV